jgi:uncharacterized lipoprotein YehR (DUF1307 family)
LKKEDKVHKRKIFLVGILIVAMLVTVGLSGCSAEELKALEAVILNADTLSGTVTVQMKDGSIQTFNFADVKAETIIAALGGLSIEPGDTVIIKQDKNGNVQGVVGNFSEVDGIINGLGTDSVSIATEHGGNITLRITPETVIRIEDRGAANFTDLQVGQKVEAKYDVTTLNAVKITVEYDDDGEGEDQEVGEDREESDVEGNITAIDLDSHNVTITTEEKGDIVVHVTSDTIIRFDERGPAAFADLELGMQVEVEYEEGSMDALEIEVDDWGEEGDNHQGEESEQGDNNRGEEGEEGDNDQGEESDED